MNFQAKYELISNKKHRVFLPKNTNATELFMIRISEYINNDILRLLIYDEMFYIIVTVNVISQFEISKLVDFINENIKKY